MYVSEITGNKNYCSKYVITPTPKRLWRHTIANKTYTFSYTLYNIEIQNRYFKNETNTLQIYKQNYTQNHAK